MRAESASAAATRRAHRRQRERAKRRFRSQTFSDERRFHGFESLIERPDERQARSAEVTTAAQARSSRLNVHAAARAQTDAQLAFIGLEQRRDFNVFLRAQNVDHV